MEIKFSPPDISNKEIENVVEVLKSGWITTGPKTKEFEKRLAKYLNVDKVVCLNSATAGIEMTLRILGVGCDDEVITTAYTYTATAAAIAHTGAKIVLVDTAKDSYEMDYEALDKAITSRTKVIIPVDIAGSPCDYDKIFEIVEKNKDSFRSSSKIQSIYNRIVVLSDSAHALGAEYKGKKIGSVADFTVFSFHAVKNITTAEGGAVSWKTTTGIDNEMLYNKYMRLSLHGQTKDAYSKLNLNSWEYDITDLAYKCNMTDIMAAIGIGQLERYEELLNRRYEILKKYNTAFKDLNVSLLVHFTKDIKSSAHLYMLRVNGINERRRNEVICKLAEKGVPTNVHYKPLPLLTAYKEIGFNIEHYPNAYEMYKNEITLPLHTSLTDEQVEYIIKSVKEVLLDVDAEMGKITE